MKIPQELDDDEGELVPEDSVSAEEQLTWFTAAGWEIDYADDIDPDGEDTGDCEDCDETA